MTLPTSGLLPSGLTPAILNPAGLFVGGEASSGGSPALFTLRTSLTEGSGGYRGVTHPANDSADYARLVPDHEGIWRGVKQNASRHYGSRLVINLANTPTNDFTAWNNNSGNVSFSGDVITLANTADAFPHAGSVSGVTGGGDYVWSIELKTNGTVPATAIKISMFDGTTRTSSADLKGVVTSEWQRFSVSKTVASGATSILPEVELNGLAGQDIAVRNWQLQDKSGSSTSTIPDEYVSVGVLSAPFHGNNQDGQKSFSTENGNTVTDSVVTQGVGLPLGRNLISNNGLANDTLIGTGGNFQDNLGDELVTNGGFDTDTGWTKVGNWTITGGVLRATAVTGGNVAFQPSSETLVLGSSYLITYTASGYSSGNFKVSVAGGSNPTTLKSANGTYSEIVTIGTLSDQFIRVESSGTLTVDIDNVSVKEVTEGSTGWTAGDSEAIVIEADGNLRMINGDGSQAYAYRSFPTVIDQIYTVWINGGGGDVSGQFRAGTVVFGAQYFNEAGISAGEIIKKTFKATTTIAYIATAVGSSVQSRYSDLAGIYITPGIPLSGLMMEGAATNLIPQPRDMTNAAWSNLGGGAVTAKNATGIDGKPNVATTITDNSAGVYEGLQESLTISASTNKILFSVAIDKDLAATKIAGFTARLQIGGTTCEEVLHLNRATGATDVSTTTGVGFDSYGALDYGTHWLLWGVMTNSNNTTAAMTLYPALGTVLGTLSPTTGSAEFDAASIIDGASYPTSPILATGAATRPSDTEYTIDGANWTPMDANGSVSLEVTPLFDVGVGVDGILSVDPSQSSRILRFSGTAKTIFMNDATTNVTFSNAWSVAGQTIGIKTNHDSNTLKQDLAIDGTGATQAAYDGSYNPTGDITLGKSLTLGMCIKNLSLYRRAKGTTWTLS